MTTQWNLKFLSEQKNSSGRKKILHMYIFITNYTKKSSFCVLTISFKHQSMRNKLSVSSHTICIVFTTNFMFLDQMLHWISSTSDLRLEEEIFKSNSLINTFKEFRIILQANTMALYYSLLIPYTNFFEITDCI